MKTKNRIFTGILISTVLASGLFAMGDMDKKDRKNIENKCMMSEETMMKHHKETILHLFNELNLTGEQKIKIEQIVADVRKNEKTPDVAFTKDSFDKDKFISIMNDRRDNMIKSQAEIIEKSYAILTAKQKEQLKVLIDLRKERMNKKL
jgi:Spy/CpxP family protein refolding chaperone